jgi:hypothetical protein
MVSTNPGLPPGRLGEVVSGGEGARLSLALAVVLAEHEGTPVLVFDEVDSGVGGRLGAAIGGKLAQLARTVRWSSSPILRRWRLRRTAIIPCAKCRAIARRWYQWMRSG